MIHGGGCGPEHGVRDTADWEVKGPVLLCAMTEVNASDHRGLTRGGVLGGRGVSGS